MAFVSIGVMITVSRVFGYARERETVEMDGLKVRLPLL